MNSFKRFCLFAFALALVASCAPREKIVYFQDLENLASMDQKEPIVFKPNDMLSIVVSASNVESAIPFNLMSVARPLAGLHTASASNLIGAGTSMEVPYMISDEGEIEFPVLGTMKISGMSVKELQDHLVGELKEYINDPIVNVRLLNFTVTILGEVIRPGTYPVNGDRLSLPEALGMAGDLSIFGRRDNILIVREVDGKKTYKYLDIRDPEILNSDYYYLQQHDIVYVEPNRAMRRSSIFDRNLSTYISFASLLLSLYVIIDKK